MIFQPSELIQGSEEWLNWRKTGIGASEMSVIMGSLPFSYEDIIELWKKKVGMQVKPFIVTPAIQEGIDTEPEAREKFIKRVGVKVEPKCFTHPEYEFLRASLDGYGVVKKRSKIVDRVAVEIKCPQMTSYKKAAKGKIIDYYYTQIQQQIACAELDYEYYYVYRKYEEDILFRVNRNEEYIQEIYRRGQIFWEGVLAKKPILPPALGINMQGYSDPFRAGNMDDYEIMPNPDYVPIPEEDKPPVEKMRKIGIKGLRKTA